MRTVYVVVKATESTDSDRTIETVAEEVKQELISGYYSRMLTANVNENHERITITAGAVIED